MAPARWSRAELERFRDATVPDLVPREVRLVFVGINPSLMTAATGTHFAHPGNRFYPALAAGGITERLLDHRAPTGDERRVGLSAADEQHLRDRGIAITNVVARATARADELTTAEFRAGAAALVARLERWRPRVVAFVGVTAYRAGFDRPEASRGRQAERLAGAVVHVLGNPSGLNAHDTVATLGAAYREAAVDAGIVSSGR